MLVFLVIFQPWMMLYYEVNETFWVMNPLVNLAWVTPFVTIFLGAVYVTGWRYPGFFAGNGTS